MAVHNGDKGLRVDPDAYIAYNKKLSYYLRDHETTDVIVNVIVEAGIEDDNVLHGLSALLNLLYNRAYRIKQFKLVQPACKCVLSASRCPKSVAAKLFRQIPSSSQWELKGIKGRNY